MLGVPSAVLAPAQAATLDACWRTDTDAASAHARLRQAQADVLAAITGLVVHSVVADPHGTPVPPARQCAVCSPMLGADARQMHLSGAAAALPFRVSVSVEKDCVSALHATVVGSAAMPALAGFVARYGGLQTRRTCMRTAHTPPGKGAALAVPCCHCCVGWLILARPSQSGRASWRLCGLCVHLCRPAAGSQCPAQESAAS